MGPRDDISDDISKAGGLSAILGAIVLAVATWLHPMSADPNDAAAAFAEYAADRIWRASHLGQLAGIVLIGVGLLALTKRLRDGRAGRWAGLGAAATLVGVALAGALQAIDGLALKTMVDRLAAAAPEQRPVAFEAAFAVRQIEVGLGSIMELFLGLAPILFGWAQRSDPRSSTALGWLGMASGAVLFAGGVVQAHVGFADATMVLTMSGSMLLLLWVVLVGVGLMRGRSEVGQAGRVGAATGEL